MPRVRDAAHPHSRVPLRATVPALLLAFALAGGCSPSQPATGPAGEAGMMGGGESSGMIAGVLSSPENAGLDIGHVQDYAEGLTVARVVAPDDGWVVLRSTVAPGGVLGYAPVRRGVNRDVHVRLSRGDSAEVRVALHVDRGRSGAFEFDGSRPDSALDKPVYVDGRPVERPAVIESYGAEVVPNSALLMAEDQHLTSGALRIRYLLVPGPSWIAVQRVEGGVPGGLLGLVSRPAGEFQEVDVPLGGDPSGEVAVTVFIDSGEPGRFDHRAASPLGSPDQPLRSADVVVSQRVRIE